MRRFLSGNAGSTAEIIFSNLGLKEKVIGEIVGIAENAIVLEVNGDLTAGCIDNILFIRVFKDPMHAREAVLESEMQTAPQNCGFPNSDQSGQTISPSLNAPGRRSQTILR